MILSDFEGKYEDIPGETAEELYENAPCGYVSFVGDGTIVKVNSTLLSWLGLEREEVLYQKKIQSLLSIGGKIFFETHFFPLIRLQGFIKEINFDLVRKDKSFFPILLNVNEVASSQANRMVYRATIFDITDRKKYEKELLDARKKAEGAARAKAEFLATISHEIRTPLNAIIGITNLIHRTPLNDQQKEYARILKLSSDGLLGLVNNILDFSKIEKGKVKIEEKVFALKDIVLTVVHTLEVKAKEKGIELHASLDENLPEYLIGDPLKLSQILINLIGNAIKFTNSGFARLGISLIEHKEENKVLLRFKVVDTGIGIPEDKLQTIFEEFSQASYDINLAYGGTGLGLTISQKLLQLHGSQMEVKSEEGEGSEFSFNILYRISKEKPKVADKNQVDRRKFESANILVVDDTPVNISIIQEYFKDWNVASDSANNGEEALELIQQKSYDLILMDLQMPEMNGYKATEEIRKLDLPKQPAVVALSASARGDISDKLRLSGFNGYVPKPFNPTDLYNALLYHISSSDNEESQDSLKGLSKSLDGEKVKESEVGKNEEPFDLSYYIKVTKKREGSLEELLKKSINAFEEYKEQFSTAIERKDTEKLAGLVHKIKMTLHYIQAKKLEKVIQEARKLIERDEKDINHIQEKMKELRAAFQEVIDGLKSANARDLIRMDK
jgi:PAS domain S-box-containing protein